MRLSGTLRELALREADVELAESVQPCPPLRGNWTGMSKEELEFYVSLASLQLLTSAAHGGRDPKRAALVKLLQAISDAETKTDSQEDESDSDAFLRDHGVDRDQYWDERSDLSPEQKLVEAIFSRKQRPPFYFEVKALACFLDGDKAAAFRNSVGA